MVWGGGFGEQVGLAKGWLYEAPGKNTLFLLRFFRLALLLFSFPCELSYFSDTYFSTSVHFFLSPSCFHLRVSFHRSLPCPLVLFSSITLPPPHIHTLVPACLYILFLPRPPCSELFLVQLRVGEEIFICNSPFYTVKEHPMCKWVS